MRSLWKLVDMHGRSIFVHREQVRRFRFMPQREPLHFLPEMSAGCGEIQQFAICGICFGLGGDAPDTDLLICNIHVALRVIGDARPRASTDCKVAHEPAANHIFARRQFPLLQLARIGRDERVKFPGRWTVVETQSRELCLQSQRCRRHLLQLKRCWLHFECAQRRRAAIVHH